MPVRAGARDDMQGTRMNVDFGASGHGPTAGRISQRLSYPSICAPQMHMRIRFIAIHNVKFVLKDDKSRIV